MNIILGVSPVSLGIHISQLHMILNTQLDPCYRVCNLTGNKLQATPLRFMVEKDTRAGIHIITLTIILGDPVSIYLCYTIRRTGIKRRCLLLWHLLNQSKHLTGGRLIKSRFRFYGADRLQHIGHTEGIDVCCGKRLLPAGSYK